MALGDFKCFADDSGNKYLARVVLLFRPWFHEHKFRSLHARYTDYEPHAGYNVPSQLVRKHQQPFSLKISRVISNRRPDTGKWVQNATRELGKQIKALCRIQAVTG